MSVGEARRRLDAGRAALIDVREPEEWAEGHVAGALHIPLGELGGRLDELPRDRDLLFFCRSARAAAWPPRPCASTASTAPPTSRAASSPGPATASP